MAYRAGATVDYLQDTHDHEEGRKISCPVLVLWGEVDAMSHHARFLDIWKQWADDVIGGPVKCGHFLPEEAPEAVLARLEPFLERAPGRRSRRLRRGI